MQKKRFFLTLLVCLMGLVGFAQKTVTGTVKDAAGEPMIGVSVVVNGTSTGSVTDINGNFTIQNVANNASLKISYIGYQTQTVKVGNQSSFNIVLKEDANSLDELVVIGYGVVKKRDLTGSVSSLKSSDIENVAAADPMQAMQAKIPGLDITQSDGQAGGALTMNLRGTRSINADNTPLILVDGVEYGSNIDLNSSDIESMEVLKDASSTAIYGTKGANGVIIITTKRGKAGKTKVNFNTQFSFVSPTFIPEIMYGDREVQRLVDAAQYKANVQSGEWDDAYMMPEDVLNGTPTNNLPYSTLEIYQDKSYTNWADLVLQNGFTRNYELSVSGGSEKTNFNISMGYRNEEGLLKRDKLKRYNAKINLDHKITKWAKVGTSILFTHRDHDKRSASVFTRYLTMTSIAHPYNDDGTIIEKPSSFYEAHCNPLLDEPEGVFQHNIMSNRIFGNVYAEITPIKGLTFKSLFNLDYRNRRDGMYADYLSVGKYQSANGGEIDVTKDNRTKWVWDNTLNYMFDVKDHSFNFLLGSSTTKTVSEGTRIYGPTPSEHYYESSFYDLNNITNPILEPTYVKTTMQSWFGRVSYSYLSRYLLTASLRADGSSVLAKGHKWGYFPSVAAAWRISDEPWMKSASNWLDNLKLRLSWGKTGNSGINAYQTLATVSDNLYYYELDGTIYGGRIPDALGNEDLTWETTSSVDLGLDFGLWNNRLWGSIDFYWTRTKDLLYAKSVPATSVFPSVLSNIGKTRGHGVEIQIGGSPIRKKNFNWDATFTLSMARDKITELSEGVTQNIAADRTGQIVGQPVHIFYYYQNDGVWGVTKNLDGTYTNEVDGYREAWLARHPDKTAADYQIAGTPGTMRVIDANDDGVIDENDRRVFKRDPDAILGLSNMLTYKNWSLSVLLFARIGGYISYGWNTNVHYDDNANWSNVDYWTFDHQNAKYPNPGAASAPQLASLAYEKASYVKIKDITLGYTFDKKLVSRWGMSNLKLYASLKNFFTFSSIDNYDPEQGGSFNFPLAKQLVFGLNVEF